MKEKKQMSATIPLTLPNQLLKEVEETARLTHLSVQDVFRQSARIAAPQLRQTFGDTPKPRRLSAWDALRGGRKKFGDELKITPMDDLVKKVTL